MLFLILILASFPRLTHLNLIEFKYDEAINLFLAARPLFGHPIPPGSTVSSVGILNPPLLNYLLSPLTIFSLDPKIFSFSIAFLNVFAIGCFYLILKKYYGSLIAFVSSSLLALSPWMILFSRKIWAQDLIFPLLIPLFYALHKILIDKKDKYWLVFSLFALLLFQLHQSTIFFLLPLTIMLIAKSKINYRYLLIGAILGFIPLLPYLTYIIQNAKADPQAFMVAKQRVGSIFRPAIFQRFLQLPGLGNFYFIFGQDIIAFSQKYALAFNLRRFFYFEYLLIPLGTFFYWRKYPKMRLLVLASILLPFIYFLIHIEPFIHYFIIISPFLFLVLGTSFARLIYDSRKVVSFFGIFLFSLILISSVIFNSSFFSYLKQRGALRGDYGRIFDQTEKESRNMFSKYCCNNDYQEMVLASYLQRNLFYGTLPLGKMIYPPQETKLRLNEIESELIARPDDPRLHLQLIAYFTQEKSPENITYLEQHLSSVPGYKIIFEEVSQFNRQ